MVYDYINKINNVKILSDIISENIITILILLNLGITIPLAIKLNIYIDEAHSLITTSKTISFSIDRALNFEVQAPLYFIILN